MVVVTGRVQEAAVEGVGEVPVAVVEGIWRGTDTDARGHRRGARRRGEVEATGEVLAATERPRPPERCAP